MKTQPKRKLTIRPELIKKIFEESLVGKGARDLSSNTIEQLFNYAKDKPYRLQITEALMIEPQYDVPMFEYSISGPLPLTGEGAEADKAFAVNLFRELNQKAQKEEYAIRYTVWFDEIRE